MKQMTEAQAWREVARRFCGNADFGLCFQIRQVERTRHLAGGVAIAMNKRLERYLTGGGFAYGETKYGEIKQNRPARALAALWLAEEAEAES